MEKAIKLIAMMLLVGNISVFAQSDDMTPYERGRYDLANKTLTMISEPLSEYDQIKIGLALVKAMEKAEDFYDEIAIVENVIITACDLGDTFKTSAAYMAQSIDMSTAYGGDILTSWRRTGEWYKMERERLEATKTELDIKREQKRAASKTGYGAIARKVAKEFRKWAKKGEYEKTSEWETRMSIYAKSTFDSLCFVKCDEAWRERVRFSIEGYDADAEMMPIKLFSEDEEGKELSSVVGNHKISPEEAQNLSTRDFDWKMSYALDLCEVNGQVYPAIAYVDFRGGNFVTFTDGVPFVVEADVVLSSMPEISKYLVGHDFVYADYVRSLKSYKDVYNIAGQYKNVFDVLFSDFDKVYRSTFPVIERMSKPLCTLEEAEYLISNYYKTLNEGLIKRGYALEKFNVNWDDFLQPYLELKTKNDIEAVMREAVLSYAALVTQQELKNYSFMSKSPLYALMCSNEEMAKLFIENNRFMNKRYKSPSSSVYRNRPCKFLLENMVMRR